MTVSAVVVSHGHGEELRSLLPVLVAEVDEVVVVANVPGSLPPELPERVRVIANDRPVGFAANVNRGVAATSAPYVLVANPDAVPAPGAVTELLGFA